VSVPCRRDPKTFSCRIVDSHAASMLTITITIVIIMVIIESSWLARCTSPVRPCRRRSRCRARRSQCRARRSDDTSSRLGARGAAQSGLWVNVSWVGVAEPSSNDWIGVFSPAAGIVNNASSPVKFQVLVHVPLPSLDAHSMRAQFANASESHLSTGSGSVVFQLINMRSDYTFGFFRGGLANAVLAAVSNTVSFANPNEPLQVRSRRECIHAKCSLHACGTSCTRG
jgi:hypothetical protein